jgi:hypothetical protein
MRVIAESLAMADGLADHEFLTCHRAWLAALRGDASLAARQIPLRPSRPIRQAVFYASALYSRTYLFAAVQASRQDDAASGDVSPIRGIRRDARSCHIGCGRG